MTRIGVISDTHGLLRPEALSTLAGVDHIVHAGDVGNAAILATLASIAPVTAVRGNNDIGDWALGLRETELLDLQAVRVYVIHDLTQLARNAPRSEVQVVVSGHSHRPATTERDGVLYVNPGSAGPRRFRLPVTVAELIILPAGVSARVIDLLAP